MGGVVLKPLQVEVVRQICGDNSARPTVLLIDDIQAVLMLQVSSSSHISLCHRVYSSLSLCASRLAFLMLILCVPQ